MIDLQTVYNIASVLGFVICMYKINKLENDIDLLRSNALVTTLTSLVLTKALKTKGVIEDNDMDINYELNIRENEGNN
jgi:hypothetical protein